MSQIIVWRSSHGFLVLKIPPKKTPNITHHPPIIPPSSPHPPTRSHLLRPRALHAPRRAAPQRCRGRGNLGWPQPCRVGGGAGRGDAAHLGRGTMKSSTCGYYNIYIYICISCMYILFIYWIFYVFVAHDFWWLFYGMSMWIWNQYFGDVTQQMISDGSTWLSVDLHHSLTVVDIYKYAGNLSDSPRWMRWMSRWLLLEATKFSCQSSAALIGDFSTSSHVNGIQWLDMDHDICTSIWGAALASMMDPYHLQPAHFTPVQLANRMMQTTLSELVFVDILSPISKCSL